MAENIIVNGITYNGVTGLILRNTSGKSIEYQPKSAITGTVGTDKHIILSGELADGVYAVSYNNNGELISIGSFGKGVTYTNVLAQASNSAGGIYHDVGYRNDYKLGSYTGQDDNNLSAAPGYFTTGFIPYTNAQARSRIPFYIKGIELNPSSPDSGMRYGLTVPGDTQWFGTGVFSPDNLNSFAITQLGDKYYMLTPNMNVSTYQAWNSKNTTHIRFTLTGSGAGVIMTLNEPIEVSATTADYVMALQDLGCDV